MELFRKEATEAFFTGEARAGLLTIAPPASLAVFGVLTALFVGFVTYATFGHVKIYAEGRGVVHPDEAPIVLHAPYAAPVRVLASPAGTRVAAGTLLVELDVHNEQAERTKCVADLDAASTELASLEGRMNDWNASQTRDRDASLAMVLIFQVRAQRDKVNVAAQRCKDLDRIVERSRIVAPSDAIVQDVVVSTGGQAREGDALVTLVPASAHLLAYLALPEQHRAEIAVGRPVRLKFDALPFDEVGAGTGTVRRVVDALPSGLKIPDAPGAVYAEVAIASMPNGVASARAGMTFTGDVLAGEGRAMSVFLGP